MKEPEMEKIARWIAEVIDETKKYRLPAEKSEIGESVRKFKEAIKANAAVKNVRSEVRELCGRFPLYKGM